MAESSFLENSYLEVDDVVAVTVTDTEEGLVMVDYDYIYEDNGMSEYEQDNIAIEEENVPTESEWDLPEKY